MLSHAPANNQPCDWLAPPSPIDSGMIGCNDEVVVAAFLPPEVGKINEPAVKFPLFLLCNPRARVDRLKGPFECILFFFFFRPVTRSGEELEMYSSSHNI